LIFATDRTGRNSFVNERYQSYTGLSFEELCGEGWLSVVHPADRPAAHEESTSSQVHLRPLERRLRIRRHDGAWRWFLSRTEPVLGASKSSSFAWLGISIDIDEQVHAEERERLLAQEVDHRAKNLLAVVQSLVQLTKADDADGLRTAINDRINALARSHSLLAASRWKGLDLVQLLRDELAAFTGRASMDGPALQLEPATAQSLALVFHELATNAAKYGALSVSGGELLVCWKIFEEGPKRVLSLQWRERGGPSVSKPTRRGFGSTVIQSSVERQLKGTVSLQWEPHGLVCNLLIPV
jgi:PAS domain S-box-containing protein